MKTSTIAFFLLVISMASLIAQTDSSKLVRVLSFNIYHGETMKGDFNLDVIAKVIEEAKPDFVALQEVDYQTNRAKKYDLVTELGWRTKMAPLFARAMYYDDGEYGEGILSKHTFYQTRNVALPYTSGNEPRAAAEITTVMPFGDTVSFIGTHLDHLKNETDRIAQATKINQVFAKNPYPSILAGDLNAVPESKTMSILKEMWTASDNSENPAPTFPSTEPRIKIDYIMFYPENRWRVVERKVIADAVASDHCAYLVVLELVD